jgi:hypothetical protein
LTESNPTQLSDNDKLAIELFHKNLSLQYDRLNFFLAGTAFLIAAFAAVVTVGGRGNQYQIHILAHAVNAVGYYLALFFFLTNFLNAAVLALIQEAIREPRTLLRQQNAFDVLAKIAETEWKLSKLKPSMLAFVRDPIGFGKRQPSSHTWIIPFLFSVFWLVTWFAVIRPYWIPSAFGVGLPLVALLIPLCIERHKSVSGKQESST